MYLLRPEAFGSILFNGSNGLFYTLNKKATHLFVEYKNGSVEEQEFQLKIGSSNLNVSKDKLTILPELPFLKNALVSPMVAYLLVTRKCNLRCKHCFVSEALVNNPLMSDMSLSQIKSTVDELKKNNILKIILTGGEVFLRADIIEIIDYVFNQGLLMQINTNATLINADILGSHSGMGEPPRL